MHRSIFSVATVVALLAFPSSGRADSDPLQMPAVACEVENSPDPSYVRFEVHRVGADDTTWGIGLKCPLPVVNDFRFKTSEDLYDVTVLVQDQNPDVAILAQLIYYGTTGTYSSTYAGGWGASDESTGGWERLTPGEYASGAAFIYNHSIALFVYLPPKDSGNRSYLIQYWVRGT